MLEEGRSVVFFFHDVVLVVKVAAVAHELVLGVGADAERGRALRDGVLLHRGVALLARVRRLKRSLLDQNRDARRLIARALDGVGRRAEHLPTLDRLLPVLKGRAVALGGRPLSLFLSGWLRAVGVEHVRGDDVRVPLCKWVFCSLGLE